MTRPSLSEREAARITSEVARRAIRRLDIFEWLVFAGTFALAIFSGAAVAWLIVGFNDPRFRTTWIVTSLLLFVIPGTIAIIQIRRADRASAVGKGHREEGHG